jgi:CheY-like chemotaxis protein
VVDDVVTNLDVARGMLKPYKIQVDCVTSGPEAIRRIREEKIRYSAIFMDHMMPGMDGIETARIIRKEIGSDYAKNVPIIALTANALLGNDALFLENGFQAFLSKPIDILRLDNILNHWVRDKKKEKERLQAQTLELREPDPGAEEGGLLKGLRIPELDTAGGLTRFNKNEESYLAVLRSYSIHTPAFIEKIKAAAPDSLADYRIAVHAIKGSSRSIGAEALGSQAEALEKAAAAQDWAFIESGNPRFIADAEKLVAGIAGFIAKTPDAAESEKPEQEAPDSQALAAVLKAAEDYDIDALRAAINVLDAFRYRTDPDLAGWLRERAGKSDFEAIRRRLAGG